LDPENSTVTLQKNNASNFNTFQTDNLTWNPDDKEKEITIYYDTYDDTEKNRLNYLKLRPYTQKDFERFMLFYRTV
jgi:hypothetical protein